MAETKTTEPTHVWKGWNVSATAPPQLLEDVMSEELAVSLALKEGTYVAPHVTDVHSQENFEGIPTEFSATEDCTSSDLLMAQMLQMEFDKEADKLLKIQQDHYNGNGKIKLSYEKYRNVHPAQQEEVYSDEEEEAVEHKIESYNMQFKKKGIRGAGKNIVTKHDPEISSRKNASNALEKFSFSIDTGDTDRYETKLPNKVYNKLRVHSMAESKRAARLHEKKDQSTATQAVDQRTRLLLFKMLNDGLLEEVHGVISVGKESAVLHAAGGEKEHPGNHSRIPLPDEVVLKVFKTTLAEFKNREKYVHGDFRLANEFKKQNPRKIMKMWAEKEMLNLKRMKKFGIACPEVVKLKKHILVMQFIGKDQVAAPKLKDAKLSPDQLSSAYRQILDGVMAMYKRCTLVHADLSEYNLLWHEGQVFFIDVSQSVDLSHPFAHEFLLRDCKNFVHFFTKHPPPDIEVPNEFELFNSITDMNLDTKVSEEEFLQQIQEYEKEQAAYDLDSQRKEFAFDLMFNRHNKKMKELESDEESEEDDEAQSDEEEEWCEGKETWLEEGVKDDKRTQNIK